MFVLYGVLSFENRVSRWIRNSDPPTTRASAEKCGLMRSSLGAKSMTNRSAGSCTSSM